ncbi:DNA-packaging protein [Parasphingopyxis marina]|uniref:DNA-packaging protein n=1 Tax=Parasphingopyxis marina TaxID=2761622 RepID=A0A842HYU2_9SPHN|nr:terminase family protein [Parasphingopyxis marina]MBC2778326.1 DNA-packaging protein [Parasphingopyxis marina]
MDDPSIAEQLARLDLPHRMELLSDLDPLQRAQFLRYWDMWSRGNQRVPPGAWRVWLLLAGRGYGKTRAGAEWVRGFASRHGACRIALVGATMQDARAIMVEGESGLLAVSDGQERPKFEPSLARLKWTNGTIAMLYSAAEPESLRGAAHHLAWADEIAKWKEGVAAWDNLMLGMRLGDYPRVMATTTPRPVPLVRRLLADRQVAVTRGRTADNRGHLGDGFVAAMTRAYGGTRLGRQELDGELIEDVEGSLWPRTLIEACRAGEAPEMKRVVIGIDPPAGAGAEQGSRRSDACGIVVAGLGADERGYVLADASVEGLRPEGWAMAAARAAERWQADRVIAEANQGGAMVESVLRAVKKRLPLRLVHATRGKSARAEPVAALYETGAVSHAGAFPALEDEMAGMTIAGGYEGPGRSPDRADALVWALTELMLGAEGRPRVRGI